MRLIRVLWYRKRYVVWGSLLGVLAFGVLTMKLIDLGEAPPVAQARPWAAIQASDTLRAVTVRSSISAFRYKGKWRGHEYEVAQRVAGELGLQLVVSFAPTEQAMLDTLFAGKADLALWPLSRSVAAAYHGGGPAPDDDAWLAQRPDSDAARMERGAVGWLRPCGYAFAQHQVVLHSRNVKPASADTARYVLAVLQDSRQHLLAAGADSLLPIAYRVAVLPSDSLTLEELVALVAEGEYDAAMADRNFAKAMQSYHTRLVLSDTLATSADTVSWFVVRQADTLAAKIDSVCRYARSKPSYAAITKRYYEQSLGNKVAIKYVLGDGHLSVYDDYFRKYAPRCHWDWRLLAAVAFVESRFDPFAESGKGARGLMQLMPSTAERYGCPEALMNDPEASIIAGVNLIEDLQKSLRSKMARTADPSLEEGGYAAADSALRATIDEQLKYFTIGAYNSGLGHIFDAIMLADTLGYDVTRWEGQVELCLELKADPAYYNNPVVKLGKFPGAVTTDYVREVLAAYAEFCGLVQ